MNPEFHRSIGAFFRRLEPLDVEWPSYYESVESEYHALSSTGVINFSLCGRIRFKGKDVLDFLNRLSTNDVKSMFDGEVRATVLVNEKGRIIDLVRLYKDSDSIWMICAPQNDKKIFQWLDRYIIRDDVKMEIVTADWDQFEIAGNLSVTLINKLFEITPRPGKFEKITFEQNSLIVSSSNLLKIPCFTILVPQIISQQLWDQLNLAGAKSCGWDAFNTHRIEQKIPLFHYELSEKFNPLEAGLLEAISFTKGCYIGQEVIARLDSSNKIQRQLYLFEFDDQVSFENNILSDEKEVGMITSSVFSIKHKKFIGLGYVKTEFVKKHNEFTIIDKAKKIGCKILEP
ncbi:hypothetical protein K1X84_03975 [bacterium]|nr:hypothetical protein [bacterium]